VKSGDVERLIAALCGDDAIRRDAASARLRLIGPPVVERLAALLQPERSARARVAALATLDGIDDPHVVSIAIDALADTDADVRLASISLLRGWVSRETGTRVLEALSATALDRAQPSEVRLAALDALSELPPALVQPILEQAPDAAPPTRFADPDGARDWVMHHADGPLSHLHDAMVLIRDCERRSTSARQIAQWRVARGAAHAALARRGSRVALYDLRESFDAATEPLPLDFLTALTAIGDASCLEPLARAWAAAPPAETWWRGRLTEAAADILKRSRLTDRNAVVKRVRAKWEGFL
jgi:hypothetical protein